MQAVKNTQKFTPNKPQDAGLEARQKLCWWHAYRFLILRRLSQLSIILMFLSGLLWDVWILKGNYSGSLLLDTVPMTDPLMTAEVLSTGHLPEWTVIIGALVIIAFYSLVASKVFCSWGCPMNMVTDTAAWLRRKLGIRQTDKISRNLRYAILAMIFVGSANRFTVVGVDQPCRRSWSSFRVRLRRNSLVSVGGVLIRLIGRGTRLVRTPLPNRRNLRSYRCQRHHQSQCNRPLTLRPLYGLLQCLP